MVGPGQLSAGSHGEGHGLRGSLELLPLRYIRGKGPICEEGVPESPHGPAPVLCGPVSPGLLSGVAAVAILLCGVSNKI